MPLDNLYNSTHRGALVVIGNSCNVNQSSASGWGPFVFMSTIPSNQVPGYLGNTTTDPNQAYSSSTLNIPDTAVVKFARLAWYTRDNVPNLNIYLPDGNLVNIPASTTYNDDVYYGQNADVTGLIDQNKSGVYTVGKFTGSGGYANWAIVVIYEEVSLPFRYFSSYVGLLPVSAGSPAPLTFTNFITPSSGPVKGYIALYYGASDLEDEASFKVGPTIPNNILGNTSTTVWNGIAPYNKSTNMFPGLICFADCNDPATIGLINTQSTLDTRNVNPYSLEYGTGSRVICDVSGLDISSTLINNQTELHTSIDFAGFGGAHSLIQSVQIDINSANIQPLKQVNKTIAGANDQLLYTMVLSNTGLLNGNDVLVVDTLPSGTAFVAGSLQVNGTTVAGSVVPPGYNVGVVPFSSITTITFLVDITTVPASTIALVNSYYLSYNFTPITTPQTASAQSNDVVTTIPIADLSNIKKAVNLRFADVGNYLLYTITIPNTGDADAGNIIFRDTIPEGTTLVTDSFVLNGTTIAGANPQNGVNIGTIASSNITTINFTVQISTIPCPNPIPNFGQVSYSSYGILPVTNISNTVQTKVNNANIEMSKYNSVAFANVGTTITYTIVLKNVGNVSATSIVFTDTIAPGTSFIANSFAIDGVTVAGDPSPPGGINIGTIAAVTSSTLTFNVVITTIPSPNPISNSATTSYSYLIDSEFGVRGSGSENSNTVETKVNRAELSPIKTVSDTYVSCGTTLTYTITIKNTGNSNAINVVFKDTIPNGTIFIIDSLTENGVTLPGQNPGNGVNLSTIPSNGTTTITYNVKVVC